MMAAMKALYTLFLLTLIAVSTPAWAGGQKLATHGDWTAYTMQDGHASVCFMASKPVATEGLSAKAKRGDVFAMIAHRSDDPSPFVFSFQAGYTYKVGSEATLKVDNQAFSLFTNEDTAWAKDAATDEKIADAIKKGSKMSLTGTSQRGTTTTDHISLKGTGAAFQTVSKACRIGG